MYQVSVKALCNFTAKRGDLDTRFTPAPSALDGIRGIESPRPDEARATKRKCHCKRSRDL
jgi:hypothetical protein